MRRNAIRSTLLIALSVLAGAVGWSGKEMLLPAAAFFPFLWSGAPTRISATLVTLGYFLAASRDLPAGVAHFFTADLWVGLCMWIGAAAAFVAVHAALWTARPGWTKAWRYLAIMVLTAIPPFGITGWAHPLTAAGILMPGWKWWGLAALTAGLMGLVTRIGPAVAVALSGLWFWSAASGTASLIPERWHGVDLQMSASLGRDLSLQRHRDLIATVRQVAANSSNQVIILPESTLGFWTPTVERLWRDGLRDTEITVIAGAAVVAAGGYDNVMVAIDARSARILYHERMPVPVSMWQPWKKWLGEPGGAQARFFANPVVEAAGKTIAPIICYEQLIVWPILHSLLSKPDVIVLIGNGWWTADGNIVAIQRASATAWARLFDLPLVISFNT
jgi:hypothetical protein